MSFYYTYITTNYTKTVLYVGMSGNLSQRILQHFNGKIDGFSKKYHCKYLVYYEKYHTPSEAIFREKQIKKYSRKKKEDLIAKLNPEWKFLNESVMISKEEYL